MNIKKLLDIALTSLNDGKAINVDLYNVKNLTNMTHFYKCTPKT